ncbi:MAG: Phosphate-binding protein PstS [bacterium]|nr:Phosphate-binding protein PstS [bacterium]
MKNIKFTLRVSALMAVGAFLLQMGCAKKSEDGGTPAEKVSIQNQGSDTMVNLAQAWAEAYSSVDSAVSVEVSGGGSGTGVAALINGTVDIANSSRKLEEGERAKAQQNTGKEPKEYMVGYDALAIFVHKDNPLNEITLEQLAAIYSADGNVTKWSQLGVQNAGCANDEIIRISRQNNSGTYHYFREAILGKGHDFRLGSVDMNGSKDVVDLVSKTPCAIGYSGMGYATHDVKVLHVAKKAGDPYVAPSIESTLDHTYPIARPLFMYTLGEPTGHVQHYLDWIHSDAGQQIVKESGYVPLPKDGSLEHATPANE